MRDAGHGMEKGEMPKPLQGGSPPARCRDMSRRRSIRRVIGIALGGVTFSSAALATPDPTQVDDADPAPRSGWELVWREEFEVDGAPDPQRWGYEEGLVRNEEEQHYTVDRRENARVEDGRLVIEARREPLANPAGDPAREEWRFRETSAYSSASLITKDRMSWTYGRIEVRARLPQGRGVWPAIWMLGQDTGWLEGGEIDIMEFVGKQPGRLHSTVHWGEPETAESPAERRRVGGLVHFSSTGNTRRDDLDRAFHVYAVEWDEEALEFFVDDERLLRFDLNQAAESPTRAFHGPHYLLLNLAIGGSWGGEVDPSIFPQRFEVDWVRVWQRSD